MSVKTDYEKLLTNQKELREIFEEKRVNLKKLQDNYNLLVAKKDSLSSLTSPLARQLFDSVSDEITTSKAILEDEEKYFSNIELLLQNLVPHIKKLQDDPTTYIEEQAEIMVSNFSDYVSKNELELASNLKTIFVFRIETIINPDAYGDYTIPTGNVFIKNNKFIVTRSEDFYFDNNLYYSERDSIYNIVHIQYTDWFHNYLRKFYQILKNKLLEAFESNENFKISFEDPNQFTLELK